MKWGNIFFFIIFTSLKILWALPESPYTPNEETLLLLHFDEKEGIPKDSSKYENEIYFFGATLVKDGKFGGAVSFNGENEYIILGKPSSMNNLTGKINMTLSVWIKTEMTFETYRKATILGKVSKDGNYGEPWFALSKTPGGYTMYMIACGMEHYSNPISFNDNKWHLLTYVINGKEGRIEMYFDGEMVYKKNIEIKIQENDEKWLIGIGRRNGGGIFYKGLMDELCVLNVPKPPFLEEEESIKSENKNLKKNDESTGGITKYKNFIFNGSFEHGIVGWFPEYICKVDGQPTDFWHNLWGAGLEDCLDSKIKHHGNYSLRLDFPRWREFLGKSVKSIWFKIPGKGFYTLSFYAKASSPDLKIKVSVKGSHTKMEKIFDLKDDWKQYVLYGEVIPEKRNNLIQIEFSSNTSQKAYIWLDEIIFTSGKVDKPVFIPRDEVEISLDFKENFSHVYLEDEPCTLLLSACSSESQKVKVEIDVINFYGKKVNKIIKEIFVEKDTASRMEIPFTYPGRGLFLLHAKAFRGENCAGENFAPLAVFDPYPARLPSLKDYPFGNEFVPHDLNVIVNKKEGVGFIKLMDCGTGYTQWPSVEPRENEFYFTTKNHPDINVRNDKGWDVDFDRHIHFIKENGIDFLGVLFRSPEWAVKRDGNRLGDHCPPKTPEELKRWEKYVEKVVSHYKDYIDFWEIWNEPGWWGGFNRGDAETYFNLLKTATPIIRRIDPTSKILAYAYSGTYWDENDTFEKFLSLGAGNYFDILSIHAGPDDNFRYISEYKKLMKKYCGQEKPIWNTEWGIFDTTWFEWAVGLTLEERLTTKSQFLASCKLARGIVIQMAEGIEKILYYQSGAASSIPSLRGPSYHSMNDTNGFPRATGATYATMASLLCDAKILEKGKLSQHIPFFIFKKNKKGDEIIVFLWTEEESETAKITVPFNSVINKVDLMNNLEKIEPQNGEIKIELKYEPTILLFRDLKIARQFLKNARLIEYKQFSPDTLFLKPQNERFKVVPSIAYDHWFQVDISKLMNMGFADDKANDGKGGWTDQGPTNDLRTFQSGKRMFYGVPFLIVDPKENNNKSCIVLQSEHTPHESFPKEVSIPLNKKIKLLYFLHAAAWAKEGLTGWYYEFFYEDGSTETLPIVIGKHLNDWWGQTGYIENDEVKFVPVKVNDKVRYIYILQWKNPIPEKTLTKINFKSACGSVVPILIAITGVD